MKLFLAAIVFTAFAVPVLCMMPQNKVQGVALEGNLNYPFISEQGGKAFLQLKLTTADIGTASERRPMNLAIVLDRSGSMGDERKLSYAKEAFYSLIDQLRPSDLLSVVVYDDQITVVRSAAAVGKNKSEIRNLVREIYPRGSTNLGGGLQEGLCQVQRYCRNEYTNRVILLSDGLANQGITDPIELNKMIRRYRNQSISVTTMGVGLDYNENLMMGLAESGGGNYYFIERPNMLASIVGKELNSVAAVIAQNATLIIHPGNGVCVNDVIGYDYSQDDGAILIAIGDLCGNEERELTIELDVPAGKGALTVATGELRYDSDKLSKRFPNFSSAVKYTHDVAVIKINHDVAVQSRADIAVSTRIVNQAMKSLDDGDQAAAERQIDEAKSYLLSSPAASMSGAGGAAMRDQIMKTESYGSILKDSSDLRKAKKSIQYENYKTRKRQ